MPNITTSELTQAELNKFILESPENAISFAISRNPRTVYRYIRQNYEDGEFPIFKEGIYNTNTAQESMFRFLSNMYNSTPEAQKAHFLYTLLHSLPNRPEQFNWTTPKS